MSKAAIEEKIQMYFNAVYEGDAQAILKVFHPSSHVYGVGENGELVDWPAEMFSKRIDTAVSTKSLGIEPVHKIHSIEFTGDNTAVAKVGLRVREIMFTDILSFIRLNDEWFIIAKVFAGVKA